MKLRTSRTRMTDEVQKLINVLACSRAVKEKLVSYSAGLADALGGCLIGLYLYGSLARGCFHPATSDVDIVAVVDGARAESALAAVSRVHQDTDIPIDAVFVTSEQLNTDRFPAPVDFLIKPLSDGEIVRLPDGSRDFPLQRQDVQECDVALFGPSPRELVQPVPWHLLAQSLDYLFPYIVPRFKNPVLMLCRIVYAYAHRKLCSKQDAGKWAMETFEQRWLTMIEEARKHYSDGIPAAHDSAGHLSSFQDYCAAYIDKLKTVGE